MNTQALNLFIVDDDPLMATGLQNYLNKRFGIDLTISTFLTGESALKKVNNDTSIVILDYSLKGENGNDVLKSIKKINPKTEVIMLSSNEDIGIAIDSFRKGATAYVIKGEKAWNKISSLVYNMFMYPVKVLVEKWGMSERLAMFMLTFAAMGSIIFFALVIVN